MSSFVRFQIGTRIELGMLDDGRIVPVDIPESEFALGIERWWSGAALPLANREGIPVEEVVLLPPLANGARIFCVAQNYPAHAAEAGGDSPSSPIVFFKPHSAFVGQGAAACIAPITNFFDYEGEIAVVIGRTVWREPAETAMDAVAGYTIANDGSARDLQPATLAGRMQIDWFAAKSLDAGSAIGPAIVSARDAVSPEEMRIITRHNGQMVQDDFGASMTHSVAAIISFLSGIVTLQPGDVILTGTPAGVGKARGVALADGDEVTVGVTGLGELVTRYVTG